MNIYFLVEGKCTEHKVYPKWLEFLLPGYKRVKVPSDASDNCYCLVSGMGYPNMLHHFENAVAEINESGLYDYLAVCVDVEETSVDERVDMFETVGRGLSGCKLFVIAQNPCFETWFLGNRTIFKRTPESDDLRRYITFYDVRQQDPEAMPSMDGELTKARFHSAYLKAIFAERGISYTKQSPKEVTEKYYFEELVKRNLETGHIATFRTFCDFCEMIKSPL